MASTTPDGLDGPVTAPRAPSVTLRLFAAARQAAGTGRVAAAGETVGAVLSEAERRYGPAFAAVLSRSRVWVNGEPAELSQSLVEADEVAVLPPVSGGA
ncbi:MAG: MoaD/ThiS family protein [Acidimicrobiales bacterium]